MTGWYTLDYFTEVPEDHHSVTDAASNSTAGLTTTSMLPRETTFHRVVILLCETFHRVGVDMFADSNAVTRADILVYKHHNQTSFTLSFNLYICTKRFTSVKICFLTFLCTSQNTINQTINIRLLRHDDLRRATNWATSGTNCYILTSETVSQS